MNKLRDFYLYALFFLAGGLVYCAIELAFRGRSHWSMLIAGGLSVTLLYIVASKSRAAPWKKWIVAGAVITTIEFITGGIVNLRLGWGVWDYSGERLNLLGQICPLFTLIWMLLSIPVLRLFEVMDRRFINKGGARYDKTNGH